MSASSYARKTRKKFLALGLSLAMACGMVAAMPAISGGLQLSGEGVMAYATDGYSIEFVKEQPATVNVGGQVKLKTWLSDAPDGTHYDFKVTEGTSLGQVNKHSGLFTGRAIGDCVVTVYLVDGDTPSQNPSNPDGTILAQADLKVQVNQAAGYGYQGKNLAIRLANQPVSKVTGDEASGYTNQLGTIVKQSDGSVLFEIQMTHGFSRYNSASAYAAYNAGNIQLKTSWGTNLGYLSSSNTGNVTIQDVDNATRTVWVKVSNTVSGNLTLSFLPDLQANNKDVTLGTTVNFTFTK